MTQFLALLIAQLVAHLIAQLLAHIHFSNHKCTLAQKFKLWCFVQEYILTKTLNSVVWCGLASVNHNKLFSIVIKKLSVLFCPFEKLRPARHGLLHTDSA